jgi:hypothetical protein
MREKELEDIVLDPSPSNEIWCRAGVSVKLPKDLKEYKSADALAEAVNEALRAGSYELGGDSYIPGPVLDDLRGENLLGFGLDGDFCDDDLELDSF